MKYENQTKDVWRGWAWNQIEERCHDVERVMVLAGDSAQDIKHAERRGIQCIGVDTSAKFVGEFRKNGGVATKDSIENQLYLHTPDGVILDMTGGVAESTSELLSIASFSSRLVVWNGLRGRDVLGGKVANSKLGFARRLDIDRKHRGAIAFDLWFSNIYTHGFMFRYEQDRGPADEHTSRLIFHALMLRCKPCFYSYRSKDSGQWFDSVAFTSPCSYMGWGKENNQSNQARKDIGSLMDAAEIPTGSKRKAAAAKAIMTMKGKPTRRRRTRRKARE